MATATVIHAVSAYPGPVINEVLTPELPPYLREGFDFKDGKIYPNHKPGLGVAFSADKGTLVDEISKPRDVSGHLRPEGSFTSL